MPRTDVGEHERMILRTTSVLLRGEDVGKRVQNPEVMAMVARLLAPMVCLLRTACGNEAKGGGSAGNTGAAAGGGAGETGATDRNAGAGMGGTSGSGGSATGGDDTGSAGTGGGATQCSYPDPAEDYADQPFFDDFDGSPGRGPATDARGASAH